MNKLMKELFDKLFSAISLILCLPVMIIIGLFVKLSSRGPIIFRQERVGQNGRVFNIYKFRTMYHDRSTQGIPVKGDPRITPFGTFLRKWKLDELPELWNVLIGDMSFVGPRPFVQRMAEKLTGDDARILHWKPGVTGPASLKYINEEEILSTVDDPDRYNNEVIFPDKVKINLEYLDHWNFARDMKILWYTLIRKRMR
jgi:lipopolysaccharide/colanic/teichoic acid biosynthesis glycosyltransferase